MNFSGKTIGFALTGSFCTYERVFTQMEALVKTGATVIPIFSNIAQQMTCRFGCSSDFIGTAERITHQQALLSIPQTEPIGPKKMLDLLVIAPCTGNTMAKLTHAITDSPVLMAAKSHLRTERPVVIALASNDSLGLNFQNLGQLYAYKHLFFVPFGQDDPVAKPNSLVAHMELLLPTIEAAFSNQQLQPVIRPY